MTRSDLNLERKSRIWQIVPKSDVICPQPCRVIESLNPSSPNNSSILSMYRGDSSPHDILDFILSQNDLDDLDPSGQTSYFIGSPPVRTNNPLVKDANFLSQLNSQSPSFFSSHLNSSNCSGKKQSSPNNCSSSPKMRIEGFTCKSVPTFA